MISTIQIKGFRKHKKLKLEFDSAVNSIVGSSYAGKSTVLRAIKWVTENTPAGTSIITWGKNRASVKLTVDKKQITRTRSKSINKYTLDEKEYEGFGMSVPQDILTLVNTNKINWQAQHDSPYWFNETAGAVSRKLNAIINLHIIDSTQSNLRAKLQTAKAQSKIIESRLNEAKSEAQATAWSIIAETELEAVQKIQKQILSTCKKRSRIDEINKRAIAHAYVRKNRSRFVSDAQPVLQIALRTKKISQNCADLSELIKRAEKAALERTKAPPSIDHITHLHEQCGTAETAVWKIKELIRRADNAEHKKWERKEATKALQERLTKLAGKTCPLCNKLWKNKNSV